MAEIINVDDLPTAVQAAELVDAMVDAANAKASRVAPCLAWDGSDEDHPLPSDDLLAEAKLILIGALSRWSDAGSGALQQQTAGPFAVTVDTRQRTGYNLWPSEITDLQALCSGSSAGVYTVSLAGDDPDDTWVPPYIGWATPYGTGF